MNYKMILYIVGQILKIVGLFMLLPIFVGFIYGENTLYRHSAYRS